MSRIHNAPRCQDKWTHTPHHDTGIDEFETVSQRVSLLSLTAIGQIIGRDAPPISTTLASEFIGRTSLKRDRRGGSGAPMAACMDSAYQLHAQLQGLIAGASNCPGSSRPGWPVWEKVGARGGAVLVLQGAPPLVRRRLASCVSRALLPIPSPDGERAFPGQGPLPFSWQVHLNRCQELGRSGRAQPRVFSRKLSQLISPVQPPSTGRATPLMKAAASEARKVMASATSSGWANRAIGTRLTISVSS